MFGTIICNKKELNKEELSRYQSVYCGLCRAIKTRYGQLERMTLNFDMTFLALMLNALYEENNESKPIHCPFHPFKAQSIFYNKYIDYAADMTILLSYYKCVDDWEDEAKRSGKLYAGFLKKDLDKIKKAYPRQANCVKESLQKINELERVPQSIPDDIVNWSGKMLSEIFVYEEDFWSDSLRQFGYELGRFIYLMDAVLDYEQDIKKNTYNPLVVMNVQPDGIMPILEQAIGAATAEFEKLPIVQDEGIMRNILYGGVWQMYNAKMKRKDEGKGR